ncbi:futalosine hydrolase [Deinococcus xianganensis]|uniref:Futalosine hydrolase n=1 Tax=Deinococcus xianganensis TaxID=1507289 RepID=A0A6I4YMG0_9DEIO|nr:futalosine hydrolase [Deinococcus xianganensis]MXV21036.1 futalosine hydrolase [Deinococcus xianganensis]
MPVSPAAPDAPSPDVLIVVATPGEAAHLRDLAARVIVSGVGPVAAALATAHALTAAPARLVISAGIGGAYPGSGLRPGDLAVSSVMVQADLGAWDGAAFLPLDDLGLSVLPDGPHGAVFPAWTHARAVADSVGAPLGPALTLGGVTGSAAQAQALERRYPGALCEGMEGAGIAHAALLAGVPALEVRGISNPVGPRDRSAWRIPEALAATRRGVQAALAVMVDG